LFKAIFYHFDYQLFLHLRAPHSPLYRFYFQKNNHNQETCQKIPIEYERIFV
jgi:hypothetical protein